MLETKPITLEIVKEINKAKNQHFFDKDTMRFFKSKIHSRQLIDDKYFITSEQFDSMHKRLYTIREFDHESGNIKTVGDFQQFRSIGEAKDFLKD